MNRFVLLFGFGLSGWVGCGGKLDYTDSDQAPDGSGSGHNGSSSSDGSFERNHSGDELDAGASADGDPGTSYADPGCPPQQWDCSDVEVKCRATEGVSLFAPQAACRCDGSRPVNAKDCGKDQDLLCGRLDIGAPNDNPVLLGCRCVSSQGYYCAECGNLGIEHGASPEKCGNRDRGIGFCGCAE
jgi:hypothetical protein